MKVLVLTGPEASSCRWIRASKALYLTAALYALFTLLAIHGWRTWRRDPALREGVAA